MKVEVVAGSAQYGLDYSVSSSDVVMVTGEREKRVPVEIIDDGLPERDETFTIRLVGTPTGGAVLGAVTETRVVIEASDDPYGAFGTSTSDAQRCLSVGYRHSTAKKN